MKVKLTVDGPLGVVGDIVDVATIAEARILVINEMATAVDAPPENTRAAKKATKKAKKKG